MRLPHSILGKQYFISIFAVATLLFCTFSFIIYRHYDDAQKLNKWTLYNFELVRQTRLLLFNLLSMETGVRGYLLTGRAHFLEPYEDAVKNIPKQIENLREMEVLNHSQQGRINYWVKEIESFKVLLSEQIRLYGAGNETPFSANLMERQKQHMDGLRQEIESQLTLQVEKLNLQIEDSYVQQKNFRYIIFSGTTLVIMAMLLATLTILSLIRRTQAANQETNAAEERFRLVMSGVNDGLYDFNPLEGSIYYSPAFRQMLGYSEEEFPNKLDSFNQALHPEDLEETWHVFRLYQQREKDRYINIFRLRHKNGNWIWVLSRGVGFWNEHGQMVRLIGSHMDISDHKKREEELSQANSDLETFTYIASHDLRSPLVNLKGFADELKFSLENLHPILEKLKAFLTPAELLLFSQTFDEEIPEALRFIESSTDRMDTLTTAVLNLSRIGKRQYVVEEVDVNAIVHKCIDAQKYEINSKKAQVTISSLPSVISDPLAIEQIFSNLIDNAIKYLENGRPGKITISAKETSADVIFAVEDNGRGIAEEDKKRIFEMLRRARNTDDVRGSGMGMSFVRATLRRLGGSIWFNSVLGSGTVFYIRLPKIKISRAAKGSV